jgi:hypothetical protein
VIKLNRKLEKLQYHVSLIVIISTDSWRSFRIKYSIIAVAMRLNSRGGRFLDFQPVATGG